MRTLNKIIAFIVMSVIGSFIIGVPIMTLVMASEANSGATSPNLGSMFAAPLIVILLTAIVVVLAPTGRSAWARAFFVNGLACFALPFAGIALSAIVGSSITANVPAEALAPATAGAAISGVVVAGGLGFVGFFAGLILLLISYGLKSRPAA